jgi:hypothetical protein
MTSFPIRRARYSIVIRGLLCACGDGDEQPPLHGLGSGFVTRGRIGVEQAEGPAAARLYVPARIE